MAELFLKYDFHPVGQGLFSTGVVKFRHHRGSRLFDTYRWVYDCGTSSARHLIRAALDDFEEAINGHSLDLVAISHFDADHINGLVDLLNKVGTNDLMLPWAPLWHRLAIAFAQNLRPQDPYFEFYLNPVQFLIREAGDGFRRIILVPFSTGEGPEEPDDDADGPWPDPDRPLELDEEDMEAWGSALNVSDKELGQLTSGIGQRHELVVLQPGSAVRVHGVWEFIPFNDPSTQLHSLEEFVSLTHTLRDELLGADGPDRSDALQQLKIHYKTHFPRRQANDLSLFLYAGPIGNWHFCRIGQLLFFPPNLNERGSILYTGDGDLSSEEKWRTLSNYLNVKRAYQPTLFQVPHHGSRHSFFDRLADLVAPRYSLFSSDPSHKAYQHPHPEVWQAFEPFGPVQVDRQSHFDLKAWLGSNK